MQQTTLRYAAPGYRVPVVEGLRGLGQSPYGSSLATGAAPAIGTAANLLTASGQVKGYTTTQGIVKVGSAAGSGFLVGGPIGAGVAAAIAAIQLLFSRKGPKQKVATTKIVDQVEPILKQNLAAYLASPRTQSDQAAALGVFDAGWAYVVQYCDIPEMGAPGKECVKDRAAGGEWDWFAYYRDPIANDPAVIPDAMVDASGNPMVTRDPATGALIPASSASVLSSLPLPLLIGGALILAALALGGSKS